ncbi:PREDICTED: uncharacterized protein LOC104817628 [Tarenaya hassleriana]|uniref:uncharacterized protein LOC104817628 n=1 Tax=Tarenaya hassleriana TaxID=28532 RepID=UPI00053C1F01|nr:PREDICTED: uncharacterized protein LOC104817628 [Tarenaya hassleriana]
MGKTLMFLMTLFITTMVTYPTRAYEDDGEPIVDPNNRLQIPVGESPEANDYNRKLFKGYSGRDLKHFLNMCMMSWECGLDIYEEMLQNKRSSDACCLEMLEKGKDCHIAMARFWFSLYEFKQYASRAIPKSYVVWNRCYRDVGPHAPSA